MCPVNMEIALTSPALLHASSCLLLFLGWQQLFQPLRFCPHIPGAAEHSPAQPGGMTRDGGGGERGDLGGLREQWHFSVSRLQGVGSRPMGVSLPPAGPLHTPRAARGSLYRPPGPSLPL